MAPSPPAALEADLRRLTLQTLPVCWLVQASLGALIGFALPIPVRPLLIDRSACGAGQWQALLGRYGALYWQDQLGQQRFSPVIQVSVLGERLSPRLPAPHRLASASPLGVREGVRLAALRERYPSALVLSCQTPDLTPPP